MALDLALYQPDIAQNTGTMLRLGACFGIAVHIIHPAGFPVSAKTLRRGALDYIDHVQYREHTNFVSFETWRATTGRRLVLLTTKASHSAYATDYRADDILMVGRETAGVPQEVADAADVRIRIPMREGLRSLNVAIAATLVVGEALRSTGGFAGLR
jgi:tRNA (cytidine/uridine-2'-O-)-methyltransferase